MSDDQPHAPSISPNSLGLTLFAGLVLSAAVVLLNVPGQAEVVLFPYEIAGTGASPRYEHGWPFTYLRREPRFAHFGFEGKHSLGGTSIWSPGEYGETVHLNAWMLAIDLTMGAMLVAAGLFAFGLWRARRQHLLQLHLADLLSLTTIVAAVLGWIVRNERVHAAEREIIARLQADAPTGTIFSEHGGPSWMREAPGGELLSICDRVVMLEVMGHNWPENDNMRIAPATGLRRLKCLRIFCGAPWKRERYCGEGLEQIATLEQLEVLDVSYTAVDDRCLDVLSRMTRLRSLSIRESEITPSGVARLRAALPDCEIVY